MRRRKNTSPPLGPDTCQMEDCGVLAQETLRASSEALRRLGFHVETDAPQQMRVCLKCWLRAMHEVQARAHTASR